MELMVEDLESHTELVRVVLKVNVDPSLLNSLDTMTTERFLITKND